MGLAADPEHARAILMDLLFPKTLLLPAHGKFSLSRAITYLKRCYSVVFRDFLVKKAKG